MQLHRPFLLLLFHSQNFCITTQCGPTPPCWYSYSFFENTFYNHVISGNVPELHAWAGCRLQACWTSSRVSQMFRLDSPGNTESCKGQILHLRFWAFELDRLCKFKRALNLNCHNYFALRCEPVLFLYFLLYMFYVFNLKCILMYQCRALWLSLLYWIVNTVDWLMAKKKPDI